MTIELSQNAITCPTGETIWHGQLNSKNLFDTCQDIKKKGGRLVALWGEDRRHSHQDYALHLAIATLQGLLCLTVPLPQDYPAYPDLSKIFPVALRMQRATFDLLGIRAEGSEDKRPWLRHHAWAGNVYPLRQDFTLQTDTDLQTYPFMPVEGEAVHEIPVGPVHAGIIEPGHFRFQVVGERVLRLEERLGYTHKGTEKRFTELDIMEASKLAGRISGDSSVAYTWAYCKAIESLAQLAIPERAHWLRALLLERERLLNHLGDLGAIGNDGGLAFALSQFSRLKEVMLRHNQAWFGHRYLRDLIVPGGIRCDLNQTITHAMRQEIAALHQEVSSLNHVYDNHGGLQDRLVSTGTISPELAEQLGMIGLAGRASGQAWDLRVQYPFTPYQHLEVKISVEHQGDVAARVKVRFAEIYESLRLLETIMAKIPAGDTLMPTDFSTLSGQGYGWVEGWRGEVLIALHLHQGKICRAHAHDPSWQNWPAIEHAVLGNIVPDFPLINKSFNLSYSGHDL
jgi:Ni,Fe-hydrogenase III large subunit/Ni,Fe-hydrogenase III component G